MKEDLMWVDMIRIVKNMLYLCIEWMFGLISVFRILERNVCRLATMILARSTGKVGDNLKERED